jgi:hypothetical protein
MPLEYSHPNINNIGWYQLTNLWNYNTIENTKLPSVNRKQFPYISRIKYSDDILAPIHYYIDKTFSIGTNYHFSTSTENFIDGKDRLIPFENFNIVLPWGEVQTISPPYINTTISTLGNDLLSNISNININSFGSINGFSQANSKTLNTNVKLTGKPVQTITSKRYVKTSNLEVESQNPITYVAKSNFSSAGISNVDIIDCPWDIQGYASFNFLNQTVVGPPASGPGSKIITISLFGEPMGAKGWHYLNDEKKLIWFDKVAPGNNTPDIDINYNLPIGGNVYDYYSNKSSSHKYLVNNFAALFVKQQEFSIKFEYINDSTFGINMYVGKNLPYKKSEIEWWQTNIDDLILSGNVTLIGKLGKSVANNGKNSQTCEFYGLEGNQYVFFVADPILEFRTKTADATGYTMSSNITYNSPWMPANQISMLSNSDGFVLSNGVKGFGTYSMITLSDFSITSNYHKSNNTINSTNNWTVTGLTDVKYTIDIGTGNTVFENNKNVKSYNSKAGNSTFYSGIWENGVWNNGLRVDNTRVEFYSIDNYYSYDKDRVWRFTIKGTTQSVSKFTIGDKVAIGNVVAIDINENRRLLKKFYKVNSTSGDLLEVEFDTDFPLRRIEIDSDNHRIMVTKNIWLNGVFLNGLFRGVWNNGLFSGYPMITKMDESHWIDGIFNGGHFTARKKSLQWEWQQNDTKLGILDNKSWLQLSTPQPHGLTKGDIISITYSTTKNEIGYFGTTEVQETPSDRSIITGIGWLDEYKNIGGGQILTVISTGLIQNFEFRSNNTSKSTSIDTMTSERVFSYNSWIDVNYSNQSAVNIGRPPTNTEKFSKRMYSDNNLYGYPTSDILSSISIFRDSYTLSNRKYFLGSKYKKTSDYVGDVSSFEDYFENTSTDKGKEQFGKLGWDFVIPITKIQIPTVKQTDFTISSGGTKSKRPLRLWINDNSYQEQLITNKVIQITGPTLDGEYVTDTSKITTKTTDIDGTTILATDNNRSTWNIDGEFIISITMSSSATFLRTPEPITSDSKTQGKELRVTVTNAGSMLDLIPAYQIPNRTNGKDKSTVERGRYTMAEFDIIDFTTGTSSTVMDKGDGVVRPAINFNNINTSIRKTYDVNGVARDSEIKSSYLPIYENVNHLTTIGKTKQEFFFNKKNLMMNFTGVGRDGMSPADFYIDNLKFYELDMIPFFKYFKSPSGKLGNINTSVQIPKNEESPLIDDSSENLVEESTQNEVINTFVAKLVAPDIGIPLGVNWQQDYSIYRTQDTEGDDIIGLYTGL